MRSFLCVDFLICSVVLIVALVGFSNAQGEGSKIIPGAKKGLMFFPRVGRSDPNLINSLHEIEPSAFETMYQSSLEDYEEYPKSEIKRASLIAFPRVGRSDGEMRKWARLLALQQALDKRAGPSETSGLWFGPRLEDEGTKNRRGGQSGLIAFPRVGRSDPNLINNLHEIEPSAFETMYQSSLEDYEEYPKSEIKRANLIAFPRVGRNDAEIRKWARLLALQQALDKRTGPSATSGLWFGPRLGKRSINNANANEQEKHTNQAEQKENY